MPEMSGVEFLRRARQLHPDSVRLVLSGYADMQSLIEALNEGAVYKFISKPWNDDMLRGNIREAFQRYAMKKEHASLVTQLAATNEELARAKQILEKTVDEQSLESLRNLDVLQVSREVLDCLPAGVVWVDKEGMIAETNSKAEEILGVETGNSAAGILPAVLKDFMRQTFREGSGGFMSWKSPQGDEFACWSHRIGAASPQAQGGVLVIERIVPGAGLPAPAIDSAAASLPLNG
jgi:CheY-like chemotaxis protein